MVLSERKIGLEQIGPISAVAKWNLDGTWRQQSGTKAPLIARTCQAPTPGALNSTLVAKKTVDIPETISSSPRHSLYDASRHPMDEQSSSPRAT